MNQHITSRASCAFVIGFVAACTPPLPPDALSPASSATSSSTCTPAEPEICGPDVAPDVCAGVEIPGRLGPRGPLFLSPDASHVAFGAPRAMGLVRLADGATVPTYPGRWRQGFRDASGKALIWDAATHQIIELGVAYALGNDPARVWLRRGGFGPYTVVDKETLVETTVAALGSSLIVRPTYTTLDIDVDGQTVKTIVSPVLLPLTSPFDNATIDAVGDRLLVRARPGAQLKLIEGASGVVTDLTARSALLTPTGILVWHDGSAVNALDLDGRRRALCTGARAELRAMTVVCDGTVLVEIASGREIGRGTAISPSSTLAYANKTSSTWELFFEEGRVSVPLDPTVNSIVQFTSDGRTAMFFDNVTTTFVNAGHPTPHVQQGYPLFGLDRGFAIFSNGSRRIFVSLEELTTVETDPVVTTYQDAATAGLFTIERPPGAVDNVVRHYRPGRPRVDLMTGGDTIAWGEQGTAIVSVETPGNPDCRNGLYAVHAPD